MHLSCHTTSDTLNLFPFSTVCECWQIFSWRTWRLMGSASEIIFGAPYRESWHQWPPQKKTIWMPWLQHSGFDSSWIRTFLVPVNWLGCLEKKISAPHLCKHMVWEPHSGMSSCFAKRFQSPQIGNEPNKCSAKIFNVLKRFFQDGKPMK